MNKYKDWLKQTLDSIKNHLQKHFKITESVQIEREGNNTDNSKQVLFKQYLRWGAVGCAVIIFIYVLVNLNTNSGRGSKSTKLLKSENVNSKKIKVQVAAEALDPERMWRNLFEDKLNAAQESQNEQLSKMSEALISRSEEMRMQSKEEMQEFSEKLNDAKNFIESALNEIREHRENKNKPTNDYQNFEEANLDSQIIEDDMGIGMPRDIKIYIPETSYVEGALMGGISVSTSVGSSSEPVPVVIRLTGAGNLPKNFKTNMKNCRILGSSYGDISSERAIIRAETMVCIDRETEEAVTTKIAGIIYGDDGLNGIKGKVVDLSKKHISSAAIGGLLSGFAGTMKSEAQFSISSLGAINTKQQDFNGRVKNNSLTGMGNAAEKIADYYIKQAESMSPVLIIPAATKVDIVFTKGVYFGSRNIADVIAKERRENKNEPK